jgi:hypothetical protein
MKRIRITYILLLLILCCKENRKRVEASNKQYSPEDYLMIGDSLVSRNIQENRVIVYVKSEGEYMKITDNKWPDKIEDSYNVIIDSNMKVYIEIPYIESGDWNNIYTYYYDKNGVLRVSKFISTFFNSVCYEGALTETTVKFYDINSKTLSTTYSLKNDKKQTVTDSSNCVFNYREDIPIYFTFDEIPLLRIMGK